MKSFRGNFQLGRVGAVQKPQYPVRKAREKAIFTGRDIMAVLRSVS
jgi:hypothetical protein